MIVREFEKGKIYTLKRSVKKDDTMLCIGTPVIFIGRDKNKDCLILDCEQTIWAVSEEDINSFEFTEMPSKFEIKIHKIKKFISNNALPLGILFVLIGILFAFSSALLIMDCPDPLPVLFILAFGLMLVIFGLLMFTVEDYYYNPVLEKENLDEMRQLLSIQIKKINPDEEFKDVSGSLQQHHNENG